MTKRKGIFIFTTILCAVALILGIIFAVRHFTNSDKFDGNISEIRDCLYSGEYNGNKITAYGGEREENYVVDGVCNGRKAFFIVTLSGQYANAPEYCVNIDKKDYSGTMVKHPFNDEYSFEIAAHPHSSEIDIVIKLDGKESTVRLTNVVSEDFVSHETALKTAYEALSDVIGESFDGEIYVRLISNPLSDGTYFWYVAFYSSKDECKSVLINSTTGEVVAKKAE